jgi:phytoene dehydrogenase-like protein
LETSNGQIIKTSNVISNASPTIVFSKMIKDKKNIPDNALKLINARRQGPSAFVVYLGLNAPPDKLNINSYGYYIGPDMDTKSAYNDINYLKPPSIQATICLNNAVPHCSPPGTSILSMTTLYGTDVWTKVQPPDYYRLKDQYADQMIDQFSQCVGAPVKDHIQEIEIATPQTFSRYTGGYKGSIYGYEQDTWDSIVLRALNQSSEQFIKGLEFSGGHSFMGHGYAPSLLSGNIAAQKTLARLKN